ncbi:hypothetical protein QBC36DRAFT_140515 [Triangularia setosa]|uniref:Uncharacterized protein n=1 Tax=Triangularia setosa TaxID=2587417 RepID=A0AAN7A6F9_9PEZI|nr:hypothetical protein QBC36DRAFT_140515 [Podospora setosa]
MSVSRRQRPPQDYRLYLRQGSATYYPHPARRETHHGFHPLALSADKRHGLALRHPRLYTRAVLCPFLREPAAVIASQSPQYAFSRARQFPSLCESQEKGVAHSSHSTSPSSCPFSPPALDRPAWFDPKSETRPPTPIIKSTKHEAKGIHTATPNTGTHPASPLPLPPKVSSLSGYLVPTVLDGQFLTKDNHYKETAQEEPKAAATAQRGWLDVFHTSKILDLDLALDLNLDLGLHRLPTGSRTRNQQLLPVFIYRVFRTERHPGDRHSTLLVNNLHVKSLKYQETAIPRSHACWSYQAPSCQKPSSASSSLLCATRQSYQHL